MLPPEQTEIPFITDPEIVRRVKQAANGLAHLEAAIPALRRELDEIARALEPRKLDVGDAA